MCVQFRNLKISIRNSALYIKKSMIFIFKVLFYFLFITKVTWLLEMGEIFVCAVKTSHFLIDQVSPLGLES